MRHFDLDYTVPMYRTNLPTEPSGAFGGEIVVSMRPIPKERIDEVISICRDYPIAHGAPVHVGDPKEIGIQDLEQPDWGTFMDFPQGEVPVFWACGVTPQVAVMQARPELAITHTPGTMLIADVDERTAPIYSYNDN